MAAMTSFHEKAGEGRTWSREQWTAI